MSENLDDETLMSILTSFAPRMGAQWDSIGMKLGEANLVTQLRPSSILGQKKILEIVQTWLQKGQKNPVDAISDALKSPGVMLVKVADEFKEECKLRPAEQPAFPHNLPPAGTHTTTGAPTICEGAQSVPDGALKMPSQNTTSSSQESSESSIAKISEEAVNNESGKEMVVDRKEVGQPTGRAAQQGPKNESDSSGESGTVTQHEVAMEYSVGQRSVPFPDLLRVAAAVCRIKWDKFRGSGSFVTDGEQFFLLTCCHNFIPPPSSPELLKEMPLDKLKEEVTTHCLIAEYGVSDKKTFKITYKCASDVLALNGDKPHLHFDQHNDLLLVKVKNPAEFDVSEPIPLKPNVKRECLLPNAQLFSIVHFPTEKKRGRVVEIAIGQKHSVEHQGSQATLVKYELDTYPGSSGSPLLYFGNSDIGIVIMAVHLHGATDKINMSPMYNEGSVLTKAVLNGMTAAFCE